MGATGSGPVGYALMGAGGFGAYCLSHYLELDCLRPVGVWNRTAEKAARLAGEHGLRHYRELEELLTDPQVELVHVATAPAHHARGALAALRAGKHVLVEKPIALRAADAERMVRLAEEKGLRLAVDFMMRYGPLAEPVKRLMRGSPLGALLRGQLFNCAGDEGLPPGHWFWDEAQSGGIFVEHGVHFFDLAAYWLGGGTVGGAGRFRRPGSEVVDQVSCTVRYGEGASIGFYHGFHQPSRLDRQEIKLIFERGEAVLRGWVADEAEILALLDEAGCAALAEILPGARARTIERLPGATLKRRWRRERADRLVKLEWSARRGRDEVYGAALRALMADLAAAVRDPGRRPRLAGPDGLAALSLALEADRISKEAPP